MEYLYTIIASLSVILIFGLIFIYEFKYYKRSKYLDKWQNYLN